MTLGTDGMHIEDEGAITTYTGRMVNPLTCGPDAIDIRDIARSLSRLCRYNGHVGGFLSVAQHSVEVAWVLKEWGEPPVVQLEGLLHDAAEAYLGDLVRPLKLGVIGEAYKKAEERLEGVIAEAFGLQHPMRPQIKAADEHVLLKVELSGPTLRWSPYRASWMPEHAEFTFLQLHTRLTREREQ